MFFLKDLLKVFANKIDKILNNNKNVSYGELRDGTKSVDRETLTKKINALFDSSDTTYSYNCKIIFSDREERHILIGRTNNYLVTRREKLIPISDIIDIELN